MWKREESCGKRGRKKGRFKWTDSRRWSAIWIKLGFPVQEWQANRGGMMHGGMICTAFDITAAAIARFCAGENYAPTISLDVKYIRPVAIGDQLIVTAKATAAGKRITQIVCEARSKNTGKLAATAASVYMNVDTTKEKR